MPGALSLLEPHPQWIEVHGQIRIVRCTVTDIFAAGVSLNPELSDQGVRLVEPVLHVVSINVVYFGPRCIPGYAIRWPDGAV
jgi:hypothetical protein